MLRHRRSERLPYGKATILLTRKRLKKAKMAAARYVESGRKGLISSRIVRIVLHRNVAMSISFGVGAYLALTYFRLPARHGQVRIVELSGPILAFTSMGFAVSLTAVALILAMPLSRVTGLMSMNSYSSEPVDVLEEDGSLVVDEIGVDALGESNKTRSFKDEDSAYVNLVAVFLITAIANVVASGVVILWALSVGGDDLLTSHKFENKFLAAFATSVVVYAGLQMLTSIRALYQVAVLIQKAMRTSIRKSN